MKSNINIAILIPTYNNWRTIQKSIQDASLYVNNIVVVNDGSTDKTEQVLSTTDMAIHIVQYQKNRGKGYALRLGFSEARRLGFSHVITMDSDGQHFASDIPNFVEAIHSFPQAIIIGNRNMRQDHIPVKSNFGRRFSNFWFWAETGIQLNDTQSGFRAYPLKSIESINFLTEKFEFEIEVLVRSAWEGIEIKQIPVDVYYPLQEERVSHFRPFRDFTRISLLNTVLFPLALIYFLPRLFFKKIKKNGWSAINELLESPNESIQVKSISIGFGIFMGIIPIWGFQLLVGISLAILFRLNKLLVILAANISIPPMIPFILFLSNALGMIWMGEHAKFIPFSADMNLESIKLALTQYVFGAITLAIIAGIASGIAMYFILKKRKTINLASGL